MSRKELRREATAYLNQLARFLKSKGVTEVQVLSGTAYSKIYRYSFGQSLGGIIVGQQLPKELQHCSDCMPTLATAYIHDKLPKLPEGLSVECDNETALCILAKPGAISL